MSNQQQTARSVRTVPAHYASFNESGRLTLDIPADDKVIGQTRATQTWPRMELITPVIALDCEFQQMYIKALSKHGHRVGRISIVNYYGETIYDVFAYYPEESGVVKKLSPKSLKLGVYWPDIKLGNGAYHIKEVEHHVSAILRKAEVVVGHSIHSDIKVFSPGVWKGVATRDTQLFEKYRELATGPDRKPGLKTLARVLLGRSIQGVEHSSVEDAWATMELYRVNEGGIERAQSGEAWKFDEDDYAQDEDHEDELEDDESTGDETVQAAGDVSNAVAKAAQMPLSAATSFWQGGIGAIKTNLIASKKGGQPRAT